jgi:hypothetical protein
VDPETVNELGFDDDDNQLLSHAGNDLFTQERAATTLQQIEVPNLDLVCPIDRDVDVIMRRQRGKWNTETTSLVFRLL